MDFQHCKVAKFRPDRPTRHAPDKSQCTLIHPEVLLYVPTWASAKKRNIEHTRSGRENNYTFETEKMNSIL